MLAASSPTIGRYDDFFTLEALALQRSTPWNDFTALIRTMHTAIHDYLSEILIEPRINGMKMSGPCLRTLVYATRALGRIVKFHNDEHPPLSEIADDIDEAWRIARRHYGIESTQNDWAEQKKKEPECLAPPIENPPNASQPGCAQAATSRPAPCRSHETAASPETPTPSNTASTPPDSASP